ncbi:T9SS type A sorting domain-containing protein [Candidatus Latescibacterota bacterium]
MNRFLSAAFAITIILCTITTSFAAWFPTTLELYVQDEVFYLFDETDVDFTVDVMGKPCKAYLWINTRLAEADKPVNLRNGYLGWHYVNKIDTTVYISGAYLFSPGTNHITWDGSGSENTSKAYMGTINPSGQVAPGRYDYYVFAYDDRNPRERVCNFLAINFYWHAQYTKIGEWHDDGTPRFNPYLWGNVGWLYPDLHAKKDDFGNITGPDIENGWYSYGPPRFTAFKFPLGSDPDDMGALETTYMPGFTGASGEELIPAPIIFDPMDENIFYCLHDKTTLKQGAMFKWHWVAGGDAIVDADWGGWDDLPIKTESNRGADEYDTSSSTDGNYIYITSPGRDSSIKWDKFYIVSFDGELVADQMLDPFYFPDSMNKNSYVNRMFAAIDVPWQAVMGGEQTCLMMMVDTDRLANGDDDYIKWMNGNGDFILDNSWDPTTTEPWQCINGDRSPNAGRHNEQWFDSNGVVVHHPDFQGLMSFVVLTQDGSGVAYAKFADDTLSATTSADPKKGSGQRVDTGSPFDGMYVGQTLFEGGGYSHYRQNINWIASDSAHGIITPVFKERYLILTSPSGGENLTAGTTQNITWTYSNVTNVKIEYSTDNGASWTEIASGIDAASGSYPWEIPIKPSAICKVRISDTADGSITDFSDGTFSITAGEENLIAFSSNRDGNFEIYVMNPDGSNQTRLTNSPGTDILPNWSPDNSEIVFSSDRSGNNDIYIMKSDGSNQLNTINSPVNDSQPVWSPDGSLIAFASNLDGVGDIYVMDTEGPYMTRITRLTDDPGNDYNPSWSPDGTRIVFGTDRYGNSEIYIMNADGTGETNISNNISPDYNPVWSPDGSQIAFHSHRGGEAQVYLMNADGSNQRNISNSSAKDYVPAWSPDGSQIAFISNRDGNEEIYVMNADGTNQRNLTNNSAGDRYPSWMKSTVAIRSLTLTSPNGGESWEAGSMHDITWTHLNMNRVMIQFSSDGGANWNIIVEDYDANTGLFSWTVPDINSSNCLIRISDEFDTDVADMSNGAFTIIPTEGVITLITPNGGEILEPGSIHNIIWISAEVNSIKIDFSVTNGSTWETVVSSMPAVPNSYSWTVPEVSSTECLIRISDANDFETADASDSPFSVSTTKSIILLAPDGGENWPSSSTQTIQWSSGNIDNIEIEYSPDGGATWLNVVPSTDASVGSYDWTIPGNEATQCKIRISDSADFNIMDESEGYFEISTDNYIDITAPGAGDIWTVTSTKEIQWGFSGVVNVKIELSIDDGANWNVLAGSVQALTGSYFFTVSDTPSAICRIRISDVSNLDIFKISERFEIRRTELYVIHTPIENAEELEELDFNAIISATWEIDSVTLYYCKAGDTDFDHYVSMELANAVNNEYALTLEYGYFTAPGMDYYIVAVDIDGNEARSPVDEGFYSITSNILGIPSTETTVGGTAQDAYRMISVPINFTSTSIDNQLKGELPGVTYGNDWRLFRYSPGSTTPDEYPDIEGFSPGKAFWFITKNDFRLNTTGGMTVTTSSPFNITLRQGWNDIANPWMFDISWDTIENPSGATLSPLYTYEGNWSDPLSPPLIMEPWKGYAVYSYSNVNTVIKLHPETAQDLEKPGVDYVNSEWMLSIKAAAGEASDISTHLGVRSDAETEWDRYDHVEPPGIGEYVSVSFPHSDWEENPYNYTVDFRPPGNTLVWDFDVKSNIVGEMVVVQFAGVEKLPEEFHVILYDLDMKEMIDNTYGSFSFVSGKGISERHFRLVVSTDEISEPEYFASEPKAFLTVSCYPNPFNPQTTIQYELSELSDVTISVFNSVGQQIVRHNAGSKEIGIHNLIFDASDFTTGTYFYRVEAGQSAVSGKMLYMK